MATSRRDCSFAMRMSERERKLLDALAAYLQRSKSDVVRLLIKEAARLGGTDPEGRENGGLVLQEEE